jgi:predicted PhzF superfamily epimerase YddE/YHI9
MSQIIYQVDSFTAVPFKGNPAGVCLLSEPAEPGWMQQVAREMSLSETAFAYPEGDHYNLRWFTPRTEVNLCGHATLATAHILWEKGRAPIDQRLAFETRSGRLTAVKQNDLIEMDFPATIARETTCPPGLPEALGVAPRWVGRSAFDYLVEVHSEAVVMALEPKFSDLLKLPVRAVLVTSFDFSQKYDFVSRFFAPSVGVNEDPVTGSAHCALAPYWAGRLKRTVLRGYQASERGGEVRMRLEADRVMLGGQAVTVMTCELL